MHLACDAHLHIFDSGAGSVEQYQALQTQLGTRRAAGDRLTRPGDAVADALGDVGDVERRPRIQADDLARGAIAIMRSANTAISGIRNSA